MGKSTNNVRTITVRAVSPNIGDSGLFAQLVVNNPTVEQDALDAIASRVHGISSARRVGSIIELRTWRQLSKRQSEILTGEFRSELESHLVGDGNPTPSHRRPYVNRR